MLKALRAQVQTVLYAVPARRKPALRRSDEPDALLATDLTLIAQEADVAAFVQTMAAQGWRTRLHNGWLLLDAPVPVPEAEMPRQLAGECGCCISLLARHPDDGPAEAAIRALVKAADAGRAYVERLCGQLHGELAVSLRRRSPLPGALLPYLCRVYHDLLRE